MICESCRTRAIVLASVVIGAGALLFFAPRTAMAGEAEAPKKKDEDDIIADIPAKKYSAEDEAEGSGSSIRA